MKNSRRMTRLARIRPKVSAMNLTSLMDVFTILVFFLIMNSGPTEVLDVERGRASGVRRRDKADRDGRHQRQYGRGACSGRARRARRRHHGDGRRRHRADRRAASRAA